MHQVDTNWTVENNILHRSTLEDLNFFFYSTIWPWTKYLKNPIVQTFIRFWIFFTVKPTHYFNNSFLYKLDA